MDKKNCNCPEFELGNFYFKPGNKYCYFWFPGDRRTPGYCKHKSHSMDCPTNGLCEKEIETFSARIMVENKVERILEMSFDHTTAMLSLLNKESRELKADSELHVIYRTGRIILRENAEGLKQHLEMLKKESKLELFQRKCQEFGI